MSNPEIRGVPGACEPEQALSSCTTEEQVRPPVPGCPGCRVDGSGHSDPVTGYLRKGHTWNALGRAKGSHNRVTVAREETARRQFVKAASKAAGVIVRTLDDPNPWVATAAAKVILERTGAMDATAASADWMEYASDAEMEQVLRIVRRAIRRMPISDERPVRRDDADDDAPINVPVLATTIRRPAPAAIEEPAPPPPDEEEF